MTDKHEPLLSSEETDALLAAVRASGGDPARAELASSDRPIRQAVGRGNRASVALAQALPRGFIRAAGFGVAAEEKPAEVLPWSAFSQSIKVGSAVATIRTRQDSCGVLVVGPSLTSYILARRLGAPPPGDQDPEPPPPRAKLTAVDIRLLAPTLAAMVQEFSEAWCGAKDAFRVDAIAGHAGDWPSLPNLEALLHVGVGITPAGSSPDSISIALSVPAVLDTAPREVQVTRDRAPGDRARMAQRLGATEVEVVAVLGTTRSSVRRIIGLSVGDVIRLEQVPEMPVELHVGGVPVLRGQPIVHHGNLSIEVVETC